MTTLTDLDRLHAEASREPWMTANDGRLAKAMRDSWPALSAYVKALEAERDASRAWYPMPSTVLTFHSDELAAVIRARLATDAAREKMEKQDG